MTETLKIISQSVTGIRKDAIIWGKWWGVRKCIYQRLQSGVGWYSHSLLLSIGGSLEDQCVCIDWGLLRGMEAQSGLQLLGPYTRHWNSSWVSCMSVDSVVNQSIRSRKWRCHANLPVPNLSLLLHSWRHGLLTWPVTLRQVFMQGTAMYGVQNKK